MKGGLWFRDFRLFSQALLAQQAWRLLSNPNSLCVQVLKARYYPDGRLEDTVFSGNASPTWQAIQYGLELLKKGLYGVSAMAGIYAFGVTVGSQRNRRGSRSRGKGLAVFGGSRSS
jgi:hypothetical protein